jgi:acetyl-CoA synthetase
MCAPSSSENPEARIRELLGIYGSPLASAAFLLCDRHNSNALAYRVVAPDLSAVDITYGELREESERFAAALFALGIRSGDRVATLMGKSRAYLVTVLAIWRLGAVHVPLFTAFASPAIALRLVGSAAKAVVCDCDQQSKLAPNDEMPVGPTWRVITTGVDLMPNSIAFADLMDSHPPGFQAAAMGGDAPIIQIYTSGTTGRPKGVIVPLRALASFQIYAEYALGLDADDVFWNAADPGWAYGLYFGVLATFLTGVKSIFFEGRFSAETAFRVLASYSVTNFAAAPTVFRSLRSCGLTPTGLKLRRASSAGEPLTPDVNEWSVNAFGISVHDHYGQTETGMLINNHHHPALRRKLKPGSMGDAMPGWTAVILKHDHDQPAAAGEVGRVAIELAPSALAWFEGYVDDPTRSEEKFSFNRRWYITGDVGRMDDEGYFYFSSRDDDVIIMAGYRIGPFEVESVLVTHPAISECAVVGVPDEVRGEALEAVVVLAEGFACSPELTEELQAWVKNRYAAHAYPRRIHYATGLPKTPSGKVQRFMVRRQLGSSRK